MALKSQILTLGALLTLTSCSVPVRGTASMTILSDQTQKMNKFFKPMNIHVDEKSCLYTGPLYLFWWGDQPVHESLITRVLDDNKADAINNAQLSTSFFAIPNLFSKNCVHVEGELVKKKGAQ